MRRLVLVSGLVMILLLVGMISWWLVQAHIDTLAHGTDEARSVARTYAAYIERMLQSVDQTTGEIAEWPALGIDQTQADALLRARKNAAPHLMDLLVLDAAGSIRQWSATGPKPDVRDRPYYRSHADNPQRNAQIDEPRPSRVHIGRWFFSFSRAVRSSNGDLDRVVVAILEAAMFDDGLRTALQPYGMSAALYHHGGKLIASSERDARRGEMAPAPVLAELAGPGHRIDDSRRPGWVEPVGAYPLSVFVQVDRSLLMTSWRARVTVTLLALAIGLALLVMLTVVLTRQASQLAETEARYRALFEQSLNGIFTYRDAAMLFANPRLAEILGHTPDSLADLAALIEAVDPADRDRVRGQLDRWQADPNEPTNITFRARSLSGSRLELEARGRAVVIDGQPAALVIVSDITAQASAHRQLRDMAYHDALTGLPNRALLFDRLSQTLFRARRAAGRFCLMMVDLDGFKAINDSRGHDTGDTVLVTLARRLRDCVRASDTVARTGGDEFVIVLESASSRDDAETIAAKVLDELSRPVHLAGGPAFVGGSIGVVFYPDNGSDMDGLMAAADGAMYAAKLAGKNVWRFADGRTRVDRPAPNVVIPWSADYDIGIEDIDEQHRALVAIANDLGQALADAAEPADISGILDRLICEAAAHFAMEEELMRRHGVADADAHATRHRELERELASLYAHIGDNGPSFALRTLRDWLLLHVTTWDRRLGEAILAGTGGKADH